MVSAADIRLYECLADTLAQRFGESEIADILGSVRNRYYDDYVVNFNTETINNSITECRACDGIISPPLLGWWNYTNPDFLIVGSNSYKDNYWKIQIGQLLKGVGFSSAFCGVVHVTKCEFSKINDVNISNCSPYIYQQIDSSRPRCIAIVGAQAFELFRTNQVNYTEAVGTSWWWGLYKVYCLPPIRDFTELSPDFTISLFQECYNHTYGISSNDLITIKNE